MKVKSYGISFINFERMLCLMFKLKNIEKLDFNRIGIFTIDSGENVK